MIQETETRIIGEDVWWDHKLQEYRSKKINLEKVPFTYRCPNCGKIIIKLRDRDSMFLGLLLRFSLIGGVCRTCFYDGFGENGEIGKELGDKYKKQEERQKQLELEEIAKYGEEPKHWLENRWTPNPEWRRWWAKHCEIDEDEKRRKNAKIVLLVID